MATPKQITPLQLFQRHDADTSNHTAYTVPTGTITVVQSIDICNTDTVQRLARVFFVPNAGSAGISNAVMYDIAIPALSTVCWAGPAYLPVGAFIVVRADAASKVTFVASGQEMQ